MIKSLPHFDYERSLWKKGFDFVAGVDEVGRGAWAGPVVAAAVIWQRNQNLKFKIKNLKLKIDDSKRLSPKQREVAAVWIKDNCLSWGIGEVKPQVINRFGMARASKMAFRRAIMDCNRKLQNFSIDYLLIDAFYIPYVRGVQHKFQMPIIRGDQKSFSIAAASIIAKVYRDSLMTSLSEQFKFKKYRWEKNKGYGTEAHQNAILRNGLTGLHRRDFVATWQQKFEARSTKSEHNCFAIVETNSNILNI